MRRALQVTLLAVLALAVTATASQAALSVRLSVRADPLIEFAHTGNIAGAPAQLSVRLAIDGSEYGGHAPPLSELSLRIAPGVRWDASGFRTCSYTAGEIRPLGPLDGLFGCPLGSTMGSGPPATLEVAFGTAITGERATVTSFYKPAGGLAFLVFGHSPVLAEVEGIGRFRPGATAHGLLLGTKWGLAETEPGAAYESLTSLGLVLGSGIEQGSSKPRFSLHMPRRCPRGYLPFSVEARFAAVGGLPAQTAKASYRASCPHGASRKRAAL